MEQTRADWAWQKFGNIYMLTAQHGMREIIIGANVDEKTGVAYPSMNNDGILREINPEHPNAKLIASASGLLELLKEIVESGKLKDRVSTNGTHLLHLKAVYAIENAE